MGNPRFSFRSAMVGYTIAIVFAFNGLLTSVIDASLAAGGNPFAITCLGAQSQGQESQGQESQGQLPGQRDNSAKCSCSLSCCCASSELNRAWHEIDAIRPVAVAELTPDRPEHGLRDFLADHRNRPRPPPALL